MQGYDVALGRTPGQWVAGLILMLVPLFLVGCQSTESATERQIAAERLARPDTILVHDFAVGPEEASTEAERAVGSQFAHALAASLVEEIRKMGLPAERADGAPAPTGSVVTIEGQFIPATGDPAEPGLIFPAGWANVIADVQIYGMGSTGARLSEDMQFALSAANLPLPATLLSDSSAPGDEASGSRAKIPTEVAAKLEAAGKEGGVAVAKEIETYFADQGWIGESPQ